MVSTIRCHCRVLCGGNSRMSVTALQRRDERVWRVGLTPDLSVTPDLSLRFQAGLPSIEEIERKLSTTKLEGVR